MQTRLNQSFSKSHLAVLVGSKPVMCEHRAETTTITSGRTMGEQKELGRYTAFPFYLISNESDCGTIAGASRPGGVGDATPPQ